MLLIREILELMRQSFILGDVFGFLPFCWNSDAELLELNLSMMRILGWFLGFFTTVFSFFSLILRSSYFGGKLGTAGQYDERWDANIETLAILVLLSSIVLQICTGLVHKEIPGFVRQIRFVTKQFVGKLCLMPCYLIWKMYSLRSSSSGVKMRYHVKISNVVQFKDVFVKQSQRS